MATETSKVICQYLKTYRENIPAVIGVDFQYRNDARKKIHVRDV